MPAYGLTARQAKGYNGNSIDNLKLLAAAGIPLLHVVGDADKVVPVAENTAVVEKRYKELGGLIKVIHKKGVGHHPHSPKANRRFYPKTRTTISWRRRPIGRASSATFDA